MNRTREFDAWLRMGRSIEFAFENGDKRYVNMSYSSFWSRIHPLFTDEDYENYDMGYPEDVHVKGGFADRMWQICKMAGYVDPKDTRIPVSVMFC